MNICISIYVPVYLHNVCLSFTKSKEKTKKNRALRRFDCLNGETESKKEEKNIQDTLFNAHAARVALYEIASATQY